MREWLVQKRKANNLSQEIVAQECDITQQAYSFFEQSTRRPKPETAIKLGKLLGFDRTAFYEDSEGTNQNVRLKMILQSYLCARIGHFCRGGFLLFATFFDCFAGCIPVSLMATSPFVGGITKTAAKTR